MPELERLFLVASCVPVPEWLSRREPPWLWKQAGMVQPGPQRPGSGVPSLPTGFFAYTCGCLVVVEDLHSGAQRHWLGHPEEISTLALSHGAQVPALHPAFSTQGWALRTAASSPLQSGTRDAVPAFPPARTAVGLWATLFWLTACPPACQVLASASGSRGTASRCHICIWDVPGGSCRHFLSYHRTAVQALAFSPDDELLVTLGQLEY